MHVKSNKTCYNDNPICCKISHAEYTESYSKAILLVYLIRFCQDRSFSFKFCHKATMQANLILSDDCMTLGYPEQTNSII